MSTPKKKEFFTESGIASIHNEATSKRAYYAVLIFAIILYIIAGIMAFITLNLFHLDLSDLGAVFLFGLLGGFSLLAIRGFFESRQKNRKILNEILENSGAARLITDQNDHTLYYNSLFKNMLPEFRDPNLDSFAELFTNARKMRTVLQRLKHKALSGESASRDTNAIIHGDVRSLRISARPMSGWKKHIEWRFDDLTDQRMAETLLRMEQEKLADFTDNAPVGFFSVDHEGTFIFANNMLEKWLGTEPGEIIGKAKLHDFLFDAPENVEPYEVFENEDDHQSGELSMMSKDGRIFKAAVTHSIVRDSGGSIRTRSIVYDLSAEQQIETALRETQDSFERLFEEAPVGICLLARDGAIDAANISFAQLFDQKTVEIQHQRFIDYIAEDDRETVRKWIETLFQSKHKSATIESHLKTKTETIVQIFGRKFRGGDSMVLHFIDLTEQKSLEQKFTQSQKMQAIGQLAGGVAHDFNNLLTAMIGFCDLLLLRHKPGDPSFTDIMQIKQNANRAANLVRQLLAFSRQQTLQPKVLEISDVLNELSHLIRRLIGAQITLNITHKSLESALIKVDQGQLEQVLINLAVNARDAMGEGGELVIETSVFENNTEIELKNTNDKLPEGKWVRIDIKDNGSGIPPEIITRIFEPFFTTKELGAGTGLGLSTVHGIVHQTGGFLALDTKIGLGTTFSIFIPFYVQTQADIVESKKETPKGEIDLSGSAKILLVEDEDAVRSFSARALTNKGYEVIEAINGRDALEKLGDQKPQLELIITDVVMPEMDGPTLIEELQKSYKDVKIIFMSGYTEDRLKQQFGNGIHFLPKPFTLKQLATKVKDVLDE